MVAVFVYYFVLLLFLVLRLQWIFNTCNLALSNTKQNCIISVLFVIIVILSFISIFFATVNSDLRFIPTNINGHDEKLICFWDVSHVIWSDFILGKILGSLAISMFNVFIWAIFVKKLKQVRIVFF